MVICCPVMALSWPIWDRICTVPCNQLQHIQHIQGKEPKELLEYQRIQIYNIISSHQISWLDVINLLTIKAAMGIARHSLPQTSYRETCLERPLA